MQRRSPPSAAPPPSSGRCRRCAELPTRTCDVSVYDSESPSGPQPLPWSLFGGIVTTDSTGRAATAAPSECQQLLAAGRSQSRSMVICTPVKVAGTPRETSGRVFSKLKPKYAATSIASFCLEEKQKKNTIFENVLLTQSSCSGEKVLKIKKRKNTASLSNQ